SWFARRSLIGCAGSVRTPTIPPQPALIGSGSWPKCMHLFICSAVSPLAPPYVMANAMERLAGGKAKLPLARHAHPLHQPKAKLFDPEARDLLFSMFGATIRRRLSSDSPERTLRRARAATNARRAVSFQEMPFAGPSLDATRALSLCLRSRCVARCSVANG